METTLYKYPGPLTTDEKKVNFLEFNIPNNDDSNGSVIKKFDCEYKAITILVIKEVENEYKVCFFYNDQERLWKVDNLNKRHGETMNSEKLAIKHIRKLIMDINFLGIFYTLSDNHKKESSPNCGSLRSNYIKTLLFSVVNNPYKKSVSTPKEKTNENS